MIQDPQYKAEMEWRDLLRYPSKLFPYSYFYFILIIGALGYLYITNLTNVGKNSISPVIRTDSLAAIQDIPLQVPRTIPPVDIMSVSIPSQDRIQKGKELFKANCVSCHGENGQGDGPTAVTLNPKPRNFHSPDGWKNGPKISQMYKTLQEGIPGSAMASYNYMPPEDRIALIHYVRSFGDKYPVDAVDELKQLDVQYNLSKGMNIAGQIPIKKAMQIIEAETAPTISRIRKKVQTVSQSTVEGADLFHRVAVDESKIFASLASAPSMWGSLDVFIKNTSADPIHLGFRANVVQLSTVEWSSMYTFIVTQFRNAE